MIRLLALLLTAAPLLAATPPDPLAPKSSAADALTSPLAAVTHLTGDPASAARFYGTAMGMNRLDFRMDAGFARAMGLRGRPLVMRFTRPVDGVAVDVVAVDSDGPNARPAWQARLPGVLGLGFPSAGNEALDARVRATGFASNAGLTSITLPCGEGCSYRVGEVHYRAPDGVLALGIDRGSMKPVGVIDVDAGVGGPAYASIVVSDAGQAKRLLGEVLGFELRRETELETSGPSGGLGLPRGTRFAFQQWYAPGAVSGYVIVMAYRGGGGLPGVAKLGPPTRGIALLSVATRDLDAIAARATAAGMRTEAKAYAKPAIGPVRALWLRTADGFPIEVYRADPEAD
ncbi:VOC family protein [Sandaracinobacteroides saxicola]|uniref:VOC domain-containing protein n=1 Tax=Sandaracinobacteroides saxicola TaxID=2759707 RepID=A0A7G5IIE9_9SPHN|nr:VOC family protein [Sandaracinobacteroides saxicola]QMW23141.1 hypothetical protein H3309_01100 [Sandaracinobacteroides saxicola]